MNGLKNLTVIHLQAFKLETKSVNAVRPINHNLYNNARYSPER